MLKLLIAVGTLVCAMAQATEAVVERANAERTRFVSIHLRDQRPTAISLRDLNGFKMMFDLRFEGTYGSDEILPTEYFYVVKPTPKDAMGKGDLKVVVSYVNVGESARVGGVTIHGRYGVCPDSSRGEVVCDAVIDESRRKLAPFDGESFSYSNGGDDPSLPVVSGAGDGAVPFCMPEPGLESLAGARCRVTILDIYKPFERWGVFFYAIHDDKGGHSGASFTLADFGNVEGNGIVLDKSKEPACVSEKTCVVYVGRLKHWPGRSTFLVEIRLKNGKPQSAVARGI